MIRVYIPLLYNAQKCVLNGSGTILRKHRAFRSGRQNSDKKGKNNA